MIKKEFVAMFIISILLLSLTYIAVEKTHDLYMLEQVPVQSTPSEITPPAVQMPPVTVPSVPCPNDVCPS